MTVLLALTAISSIVHTGIIIKAVKSFYDKFNVISTCYEEKEENKTKQQGIRRKPILDAQVVPYSSWLGASACAFALPNVGLPIMYYYSRASNQLPGKIPSLLGTIGAINYIIIGPCILIKSVLNNKHLAIPKLSFKHYLGVFDCLFQIVITLTAEKFLWSECNLLKDKNEDLHDDNDDDDDETEEPECQTAIDTDIVIHWATPALLGLVHSGFGTLALYCSYKIMISRKRKNFKKVKYFKTALSISRALCISHGALVLMEASLFVSLGFFNVWSSLDTTQNRLDINDNLNSTTSQSTPPDVSGTVENSFKNTASYLNELKSVTLGKKLILYVPYLAAFSPLLLELVT